MIVIVGPTACGKTTLAVKLATHINGEIISADSRQVYRNMNIGTGKDIDEYVVPYHLIDIVEAGEEYTLFDYLEAFNIAYEDIISRSKVPILCGGSGMYVEAAIKNYNLPQVPPNAALREELSTLNTEELIARLSRVKSLHNTTDITSRKRLIRAIEIGENPDNKQHFTAKARNTVIFGIDIDREERRRRITLRLEERLKHGLVEEVEMLLSNGIPAERLIYYGLEYKFVTQHLLGQLSFERMKEDLNIAIHQFAKRQMTWFRGMERRNLPIVWIDGTMATTQQRDTIIGYLEEKSLSL